MMSLLLNTNLNQYLITTLWIWPLYLINGQTSKTGLRRQARITDEIRIATQGYSRCKDGGRGTLMMGLDNRGGVMLWILNVSGVFTERFNRCLTTDRSMRCSNKRSCQHQISCSVKKRELRFPLTWDQALFSFRFENNISAYQNR